ncbi:MAG: hypothetical protein U0R52_04340 [Solirubrobacterales bacterium]
MTRAPIALALAALCLLAPATGASARPTRAPLPAGPELAVPPLPLPRQRDTLIDGSRRAAARAIPSAPARRYSVHDGRGRRVRIAVSAACRRTCNADSPQGIADLLGTLPHAGEINLLTVRLVTGTEVSAACGSGALACYHIGQDLMFINGSGHRSPDGATRAFVIAHEYGHHVAQHRSNPPFLPTVYWGTKRWTTYMRVCQLTRQGHLFPGDEGVNYYRDPGEGFAESFAFQRFRRAPVRWAWTNLLKPDADAFAAIREDTLNPWKGRTSVGYSGSLTAARARVAFPLRTPLDGTLDLRLRGPAGADYGLALHDASGHLLASSDRPGPAESLRFTVCGQARLRAVVSRDSGSGPFELTALRP